MSYIGNSPTSVAFLTDQFSGTGSQVAFTLSAAPANPASILVAVSGVLQDPSTYGVSSNTLTFTAAPPTGTGNISVRYLGVPASNITTAAYRTVTELTATAGQTTFTPASYNAGYINVYRNGVLLGTSDYTATNGTTVVLGTACVAGELIAVESFYISTVIGAIPATAGAVTSTYIQTSPTLTTPILASPTINGTYTAGTSLITAGTTQNTTSGSSIPFTGIPSWVKRITVVYTGLSTSSTTQPQFQLGTSAGLVSTAGQYVGQATYNNASAIAAGSLTTATGFDLINAASSWSATNLYQGVATFTNIVGSNTWIGAGTIAANGSQGGSFTGTITLPSTLDRVALVVGAGTFDAGSINILYE